ncbi:MAG TPA: hypothetical protein VF761_03980 [Gemmatimonadaceae bacterium]
MRVTLSKLAIVLSTATISLGAARVAAAQGKSHGHANPHAAAAAHADDREGKEKKHASSDDGVRITREVLESKGFEVVRVERSGGDRVVYYRRGNMGRGKGKGPIVKMYVRQAAPDRVTFDKTPAEVLAEIHRRMAQ